MLNSDNKFTPQVNTKRVEIAEKIPLSTPLVLYVEPSGQCNLKCIFCMHGASNEKFKKSLMTIEIFEKMIDDLNQFSKKIKLLRVCGNGEPLMNNNIIQMLKYARESDMIERTELITNGILLNKHLTSEIPKLLDRIIISIEGLNSDDYYKITGTKVDFKKLIHKIKTLHAQSDDCTIHVKIHNEAVSTNERRDKFYDIFNEHSDEISIENLVPMWPELKINCQTEQYRYDGALIKKEVCVQIFKGLQVQADGEVVSCCVDWKRKNLIGDISSNSLLEIWQGESLKKLQRKHLNGKKQSIKPCKDCTMNDYCEIDNIDHAIDRLRKNHKLH